MSRPSGRALSLTGNRHDAEDLLQDTLAKIIDKWSKVSASRSPGAYARSMMVNTFLSAKRRSASGEVVSDAVVRSHARVTGGAADQVADRDALLRLAGGLPRQQRAVLALRFYEDMPVAEVARVLDISKVAVRSSCHKALTTLRASMAEHADIETTDRRLRPA
ncbi:hypothetical protein VV01_03100 [Luteipulveratus halotolerans]|uniref:Uncharacterized protein n=2 Tax=Luteipulveratus halotolerans TaxID=1631356 RepID=A0A0L6CN58_9MICO|nr:hypothetical protein VV01_03100 [Luteipulveratus halotolerans]